MINYKEISKPYQPITIIPIDNRGVVETFNDIC